MNNENNFHMTPEEFRKEGKKLIDWIADYYEHIEEFPVLSQIQPGEIRDALPETAPEQGESMDKIMQDVEELIMPGITHWQSPNFFAYFNSNTSFPSILGDLLSSGLGVQGMIWATSPAATEVETKVLDWLTRMMQLPEAFLSHSTGGGVIQDTASTAALTAIVAARERATQFSSNQIGIQQRLVAYVSTQTHSSIEKGIKIAGIGSSNLRKIEVDDSFAMRSDLLQQQIKKDRSEGYIPFFICGTVGTTSSTAIDPIDEIGKIAQREKCWYHIDAASLGTAMICPEFRHLIKGVEWADSYTFNPHKWMFTNFDCNVFWVKHRQELINTFSILPEYLRNQATESGEVFDYRDWHIQLGRRFRALKLWFVIRHYGIKGLQFHVREHVRLARLFHQLVGSSKKFVVPVAPTLNLVCFKHVAGNDFNTTLMNTLNAQGKIYLTHTKLNEDIVLRMNIGQTHVQEQHIRTAWKLIENTAKLLESAQE